MNLEIVILAAGRGTRMQSQLPKVLHQLAGRTLLQHVLETARQLGPARIHVVVGYGAADVQRVFEGEADLSWVLQTDQAGTGHALRQALPHISESAIVLVLCGDNPLVSVETLRGALAGLSPTPATGEVATNQQFVLVTTDASDPTGLGRILRNSTGGLQAIVEEQDATDDERNIHEVNSGIMASPKQLLQPYLEALQTHNAQHELYLTDVVAMAVADKVDISVYKCPDEFEVAGINDRVQLAALERRYQHRAAESLMLSGVTLMDPCRLDIRGEVVAGMDCVFDANVILAGKVKLGARVKLGSGVCIRDCEIGDDALIHPNTVIEGALIGCRCELGPFARVRPGSELADAVKLGNFVEVKNSHIGAGTKASHLSYLGDATIGVSTNIGAGTIVCNYDGLSKHRTVIGDDVFIGSNATLIAPLRIGANSFIAAGSTVTTTVEDGELAIGRGKQRNIQGWIPPAKRKKDAQ